MKELTVKDKLMKVSNSISHFSLVDADGDLNKVGMIVGISFIIFVIFITAWIV